MEKKVFHPIRVKAVRVNDGDIKTTVVTRIMVLPMIPNIETFLN